MTRSLYHYPSLLAGVAAHVAWEAIRKDRNECDAEEDIADQVTDQGVDMGSWWQGWFERSDAWRDEIEFND